MLNKLFTNKSKKNTISVMAPVDGEVIPLTEVPDPVFSEKNMGDGVAIKPTGGTVVSPVKGTIIQLFSTNHAIGIQTENGAEILIHIGLDTVELEGEGFSSYVEQGSRVNVGDKLITFDVELVKRKATSEIIPVIITNTDQMKEISPTGQDTVTASQDVLMKLEIEKH
ncbi:PTS sugar transporter subunit IIA [Lentibacillus salicampi]|uniref:PTS glucose transporter subunit IIA n=1 Tax=Lentibacillus salicampi TaxID=175306 RepID=A0A4Y9A8G4_9BACI|nr:PTS glucose transporter subunit IIA [Lentibacillus salicampi]TFJ91407.1 PTS glucose transporter subunit IIA [Lentibacillus salicampi]